MQTADVYFRTGDATLDDAAREIAAQGLTVSKSGEMLVIPWELDGKSHEFQVRLVSGSDVLARAKALGQSRHDASEHASFIGGASARFEIGIRDLDAALDEINTLMQVEVALTDLTRGFIHLPWNDSFLRWNELMEA